MPELTPESVRNILEQIKDNDEITRAMDEQAQRKCGHCAACCTWLGIEELKKYQGQTCVNLKNGDPNKRCGIYNDRPVQCQIYLCSWRIGLFPDDYRPDLCGFIVSAFANEQDATLPPIFIINIFDRLKSGQLLKGSKLFEALQRIMASGENYDIRIIDIKAKQIVQLVDGEIWEGQVLKNARGDYHSLQFIRERNIGRYETQTKE